MSGRNKEKRRLPNYFHKDQVGGLTHLLIMARQSGNLADPDVYRNALGKYYDPDIVDASMKGIAILLTPDKHKWEQFDHMMIMEAGASEEMYQQLLSLLIYRATVPLLENDKLAQLLLPGSATRNRALNYIRQFFGDMEQVASGWDA